MNAIQFHRYGGPEVLQWTTVADPEPGPGEVRVRLHGAGVAPVDAKLRAGLLQAHFNVGFPKIPGRDGVGVIDRLGPGVTMLSAGDPVCAMADPLRAGTYAELLVCSAERVVRRPLRLSAPEAAVLMQPGLSAWTAVTQTAKVEPGMRVLVHGAAGAVGHAMVQLATSLGADVSATCRAGNIDYVLESGAARAFAYDRDDFGILRGQDVVFDVIGGSTHDRSYQVLRSGGHLVYLTAAPTVDRGGEFGVRVTRATIVDAPAALLAVARAADDGVLSPRVAGVFRLQDAGNAHAALEGGRVTRGRLALEIDPAPFAA